LINLNNVISVVVKGLKEYINAPIIRLNQNAPPPNYPYACYNITTLQSKNNGTWGIYKDGIERIPITQTWSLTFQSSRIYESEELAIKAKNWFENIGRQYLKDNNIIIQSVGSITNRDNIISIEYEYKNGFDVVLWFLDEVEKNIETIETVIFKNKGA